MFRVCWAAVVAALAMAGAARADEGMWPFDEVPVARMKDALGVSVDGRWLDHLRGASVRLTDGCSASIVSRRGLVLTSQHCVLACAEAISPPDADYVSAGFQADGLAQERACPGMQAEVLVGIVDVTGAVYGASEGKTGAAWVAARETAIAQAERSACGGDARYRCEAISFYEGGQFKVYKFRRYADVRLVFAPELAAAFFGGDPDNFNFPRYDLDCAFLRLYDDGRPAATPDFLAWRDQPPRAGEAVFMSGSPGQTERRLTVAQLVSLRDVALPLLTEQEAALRAGLVALSAQSPALRRASEGPIFTHENDLKLLAGREAALKDPGLLAARARDEADLEARLAADPKLAAQVGDPWTEIEAVQKAYVRQFAVWRELEAGAGGGSQLFRYARDLVRAAAERTKPASRRLPEYADSRLPLVQKLTLDPRPVTPALERLYLQSWLAEAQRRLGPDTAAVTMLLGQETPQALASRLVAGTRLADPAVRRKLWEGGLAAVEASDDPMIRFVLRTDPLSRAAREVWEEEVVGPTLDAGERIARVRFELEGDGLYPDATFSLRLSYGKVAGWSDKGRDTGPFTTFAGLYARATGVAPYVLPARWMDDQAKLDPGAVLDFATTNDITGGGSGSPVVDAKGRLVGAAFDGNIHSIAGDYAYDGALNRTIAVSTTAIAEALTKVYADTALAKELTGQ